VLASVSRRRPNSFSGDTRTRATFHLSLFRNFSVLFGVRSRWNHFPPEKLSLVLVGPILRDGGPVRIADSGQGFQSDSLARLIFTSGNASCAVAFCAVSALGGVFLSSAFWAGTEPVSA
jgi:hypothetical protein